VILAALAPAGRWLIAAGLIILLGAWGRGDAAAGRALRPGTEVFAVDPALVLEVSHRSAAGYLHALRRDPQDSFTLTIQFPGRPQPETCPAGAGFATFLRQITSLKLIHTWEGDRLADLLRRHPLSGWPELLIRDASRLEPFQARLLPVADSPGQALVHFGGATYSVALDHQVFRLLDGGCASLGATAPR